MPPGGRQRRGGISPRGGGGIRAYGPITRSTRTFIVENGEVIPTQPTMEQGDNMARRRRNDNEATEEVIGVAGETNPTTTDYEIRLAAVVRLKEMTDTQAWQDLHRSIQTMIQVHAREVLEAEKNREVILHQQGVKILRTVLKQVRIPVDNLNDYITAMPLMSSQMGTRARWIDELGQVELYEV